MRRPEGGGKGLDGVAARAPGYLNPAVDLLESGETK
jgi:beta-lysine 5,6-aminomutase alpha subunit